MKTYLEVLGRVKGWHGKDADEVLDSIEVTEMSDDNISTQVTVLKDKYPGATFRQHICKHDENLPCVVMKIA